MPSSTKTRSQLKAYFVKNAIPTEGNFADLIDGQLNQGDDGIFKQPNQPLALVAADGEQKRALQLYSTYPAANPDWLVSLNPRNLAGTATVAGFGIADGAGNTRLMLAPDGSLTVSGNLGYSGQLSKLDVAENASVTLRAADFNLGHSSRRGTPGRALVDNKTALVLNYAKDWASTTIDSPLTINGNLRVNGSRIENSTGLDIVQADAIDWLRINPAGDFPATAIYKPVAIGTGGLSVGDWSQQAAGNINATGSLTVKGTATIASGVLANSIGLGTQTQGATTWPYETIQMNPNNNLRIWFASTERFFFGNTGSLVLKFNQGYWAFQTDGNLVKYNSAGVALWALNAVSGKAGWS
jgi:hypothetical protein